MKDLKNLIIFSAGVATCVYLMAKGAELDARYPREGSIIFEDDKIKVVRVCSEPAKSGVDLAVVVDKSKAKL